jgi:hypothetical protein
MGFGASEIKLLQRGPHLTSARTPGLPDSGAAWEVWASTSAAQYRCQTQPLQPRRRQVSGTGGGGRSFDRAHERRGVGEVVHGQGKRIATGVRVGHRGCGSMADVAQRGAVAIAAIRVCGCDDSPRH